MKIKILLFLFVILVQVSIAQTYTYQSFANYEDVVIYHAPYDTDLVEPFASFFAEHGSYDTEGFIGDPEFDDDPGNFLLQMTVPAEHAGELESLLDNSPLIFKTLKYEDDVDVVLDRLVLAFNEDEVPEFLGIEDGIVQTNYEPLNTLFENYQVENYALTYPDASWPYNFTIYHVRCDGCDIFEFENDLSSLDIFNYIYLVEFGYLLSLDDNHLLSKTVSIMPNPNNGTFEIRTTSDSLNTIGIQVFDVIGKKIFENPTFDVNNEVVLPQTEAGVYYVKIISDKGTTTKKIIIN